MESDKVTVDAQRVREAVEVFGTLRELFADEDIQRIVGFDDRSDAALTEIDRIVEEFNRALLTL